MKKDNDELEIVEVEELEELESEEVEVLDEEYNEDEQITEVEVIAEEPAEDEVEETAKVETKPRRRGLLLDEEKDTKSVKILKIVSYVLPVIIAGVVIYCAYMFITKMSDYKEAEKLVVVFEENPDAPSIPEPIVITSSSMPDNTLASTAGESQQVVIQKYQYNYSNLTAQAPEAAGYLNVANTNIQYPVMWSEDDEYYLTHSSNGSVNGNGAIFLTSSNNPDFSDSTNYIFGHNMTNGLMFRSLNNYISGGTVNYTYLASHNAAYLVTPYETETYYIFWAEVIDPEADEYVTTGTKEDIASRAGVDIPADAKLLILVTCYTQKNSNRVLVYGYKI